MSGMVLAGGSGAPPLSGNVGVLNQRLDLQQIDDILPAPKPAARRHLHGRRCLISAINIQIGLAAQVYTGFVSCIKNVTNRPYLADTKEPPPMHPSALQIGQKFLELYWQTSFGRILDVGSRDINGSLRTFRPADAEYIGIDLEPGKGVDVVLDDPYKYPFPDGYFDIVLSTSCLEHDRLFWLGFLEQVRVLSGQGVIYINAPSNGAYHGYPYDNWRFYPDASLALEEWSCRMGRELYMVESFIAPKIEMGWNDCVMVFCKASPETLIQNSLFSHFPGSHNIRRFGSQEIINFSLLPQDEQIINSLNNRIAELNAVIANLNTEENA
jgi:SAM-dependent methyltransferase